MRDAARPGLALLLLSLVPLMACAAGGTSGAADAGGSSGTQVASVSVSSAGGGGSGGSAASTSGAGGAPAKPPKVCAVPKDGLDAVPFCDDTTKPADTIELVEKWHFHAKAPGFVQIINAPLVANLTDDDGDGVIDLCDTPDVLVQVVYGDDYPEIKLLVLSGKDGSLERTIDPGGLTVASPAIADLDGDGTPEILVTNSAGHVMALSPDGAVLWEGTAEVFDPIGWYQIDPTPPLADSLRSRYVTYSAVSVADLDGDGSPEILVGMSVLDAHGGLRFQDPTQAAEFGILDFYGYVRPVAADLDGDGKLEVLFGHIGYRADGTELFHLPITPGYTQVGDFFGDGQALVLVTSVEGLTLVSSTGKVIWGPVRPPDDAAAISPNSWVHPAAIVDMDGDGLPEALVNTGDRRMVIRIEASGPTILRSAPIPAPGYSIAITSGSTAFDFRGAGPDWLAYYPRGLSLFDGMGPAVQSELAITLMDSPFSPVVADIDDDGSADVLLVRGGSSVVATDVVAYEDALRRPSPARRIWNQWNYVASAIREDAKLAKATPPDPKKTFRVQSTLACQVAVPPH